MDGPKSMLPRAEVVHDAENGPALPLFTTAEQLSQEFIEHLIGRPICRDRALLVDHREFVFTGEGWTVLVPAPGEQVSGSLYRNLVAEDYRRIDSYQGVLEGLYQRMLAAVRPEPSGTIEPAFVYLPTERTLGRYSAEPRR